jgi:hypothetical protein
LIVSLSLSSVDFDLLSKSTKKIDLINMTSLTILSEFIADSLSSLIYACTGLLLRIRLNLHVYPCIDIVHACLALFNDSCIADS